MKPGEHRCEQPGCERAAVFGWGPPALLQPHWWCAEHAPSSFFEWLRTGRAPTQAQAAA
jgi:hypothetical protein